MGETHVESVALIAHLTECARLYFHHNNYVSFRSYGIRSTRSIICNQSAYRLWLLSKGKYLHWISNAFMYVQLIVRNVSQFFIFYFFFYEFQII